MDLADQKRSLRAEIKRRLSETGPADRDRWSHEAAQQICAADWFAEVKLLMAFWPLDEEIDARPIMAAALAMGKRVCLPKVSQADRRLIPVELRQMDEAMDVDRFGVRTPQAGAELPVDELDLVVTPGLAFDHDGGRLGRGGGYYDRLFADPACRAVRCGLAFEMQVVPSVPTGPNDAPLDWLATEAALTQAAAPN